MTEYGITVTQHRTYNFLATIKESGAVQDINGYTFFIAVKKDPKDKKIILTKQLTVFGDDGKVSFTLTPEETARLSIGKHYYDIKMVKPSTEVSTLISGRFNVKRSIGE